MSRLDALLSAPGFKVMDGGMGTTIEDRGFSVRNVLWGSVPLLSPEGREVNDQIHRDFAAAGAEILIANTHNASLEACRAHAREHGLDADRLLRNLNRSAVESARAAAPAVVAGCIGSVEPAYSTESRLTPEEVTERVAAQVEVLTADVDLLLFETLSTRAEVEGIARTVARLAETHPDLPIGIGFTCGTAGTTHGGVSMDEAVQTFEVPPRLFFVQCTRYDLVEAPLDALIAATGDARRTGVYANDGRSWIDRCWHGPRIGAEEYAEWARRWAARGVAVIGGCCGTGPEHVAALSALRRV